jgi:hypothetical protein
MKMTTFVMTMTLVTASTIVSAQKVNYDYNKLVDFSRYTTYAWVRGHIVNDPLIDARIVAAVNSQLAAKGLRLMDSPEQADVLVAYHASIDRDVQITGFSSGWGGFRFPGSSSGIARADEILNGTLIVDMVDAATRAIVWRGVATRELDVNANPARRDKNITRTAEKLFSHYPPAR